MPPAMATTTIEAISAVDRPICWPKTGAILFQAPDRTPARIVPTAATGELRNSIITSSFTLVSGAGDWARDRVVGITASAKRIAQSMKGMVSSGWEKGRTYCPPIIAAMVVII